MGLFDNIFGGQKSTEVSKAEAFAGVLLGAVAADGVISSEEAQGLCTALSRMKMYDNWTGDKFNNMLNRMLGAIKRQGLEKTLQLCAASLPKELHETAFANACDLVLADGVVEDEEKEFLDKLQKILEVSGDQALTIVEVMIIKNRG
jgi:tellurite resistance protein